MNAQEEDQLFEQIRPQLGLSSNPYFHHSLMTYRVISPYLKFWALLKQFLSTDDQDCAIQIEKLNQLGCNKVYADKSTGKNVNRAQLQQCLDYVREGDVLAFTRVDRLGRSLKDLVTISDELKKKGVGLFIVQQNLDTSTPMGQMFYAMLGIMAEFEYHLKRERQTEGIVRAKNLGRYKGRKPLSMDMREKVKALLAQNVGPSKIAAELGIGRTSIYKYCLWQQAL